MSPASARTTCTFHAPRQKSPPSGAGPARTGDRLAALRARGTTDRRVNSDRAGRLDDLAACTPPPPGGAGLYALAGRPQGLRRLMIAGGRVPAGEAGPM